MLTMRATQAGFIMGTEADIPPEQAKGKSVDRRADIWEFGVALLEMLTGQKTYSETPLPKSPSPNFPAPLRFRREQDPASGCPKLKVDEAAVSLLRRNRSGRSNPPWDCRYSASPGGCPHRNR